MLGADSVQCGRIGAEHRGDQLAYRVGARRRGTLREEVVGDLGVTVELGELDRRPAIAGTPRGPVPGERWTEVDAVLDEQPHPGGLVVLDRPAQLDTQYLRGCVQLLDPRLPRAAVATAEPVFEQQLQVRVVRLGHPVVQGLGIVGVGAGVE
jgi:hypothetical protein